MRFMKSIVLASSLITTGSVLADNQDFYPYLGLDYKWQHTEARKDWKKIMPKCYSGGTVYFGERFNDCWGIEFGYNETAKKSRNHTFAYGENFFENGNAGGTETTAKIKFRSGYLDVNGYYPLNDCVELIGSVGAGIIRPKIRMDIPFIGPANGNTGFFQHDANALTTTRGKTKGLVRAGAGAQVFISDCVGIRAMFRWESTSLLRVKGDNSFQQATINTHSLKRMFKDSYSLNIGVFLKFL